MSCWLVAVNVCHHFVREEFSLVHLPMVGVPVDSFDSFRELSYLSNTAFLNFARSMNSTGSISVSSSSYVNRFGFFDLRPRS